MNGSAPNCPATGSQTSVRQKLSPNFPIDSIDCRVSSNPIARTIRTSTVANAPVPRRNPRSVAYPRVDFTGPGTALTLRDLDLLERRHLELYDTVGQRRIAERARELLAVGKRPLHEIHHDLRLRLVLRVFVEQEPRER